MFRQQEGQPGHGLSACSLLPSYSVIPPALPHSQNLAVDRHGTLGPTLDLMSHNLNLKKKSHRDLHKRYLENLPLRDMCGARLEVLTRRLQSSAHPQCWCS